jgi:dTDP-glucose 4,6-dehydratase
MNNEQIDYRSPLAIPDEDLHRCDDILGIASWSELARKRVFITGGTSFIGKWLLATLLDANGRLGLDRSVMVVGRVLDFV